MNSTEKPGKIIPFPSKSLPFHKRRDLVRQASGPRKFDLIIDSPDAEKMVRALPPQEAYLLLRELGPDDASELVALSSTEQMTFYIDMDAWEDDRLEGERLDRLIEHLLDAGEEKVLRTLHEMDFELLVLLLKKRVTVIRGPEAYEDEDQKPEIIALTGGYDLEFNHPEQAKATAALLDVIARKDMEFYLRLLEGVRWEHESPLEEEVYRFRVGRLQDQGFPDPFEAMGVYAWIAPDNFDPKQHAKTSELFAEKGLAPPGFVLTNLQTPELLSKILVEGLDREVGWELTFLINKILTANRVDPGDSEEVEAAMKEAYRNINLALEHLSGGDLSAAQQAFREIYLETLFRLGFSLTGELRRRAEEISRTPLFPWLDPPFRAFLDALKLKKPLFFEGISEETRGGTRPFSDLHDIRNAREWLNRLEALGTLFLQRLPFDLPDREVWNLAGCQPENTEEISLSDLFLTSLANRLLGREFAPSPIVVSDIGILHDKICKAGSIMANLKEETAEWLNGLVMGTDYFGEYCLKMWEEEFCGIGKDAIDPRYVPGLITRMS